MATITQLPDEVIEIILSDKNISIEDIMNLNSTCKRFQSVTLSKKFLEQKFYLRCPTAKIKYTIEKREKILNNTDFKEQIIIGLKYVEDLQNYVHLMSENDLRDTDKEKLECLLRSVGENPKSLIYYFVIDELDRIVSTQLLHSRSDNVAVLHNFYIIIRCIKQYRLMYKKKKFLNMPEERQLLEQLLTIVGQYFDPQMSFSCIKTWLDNIVQKVLFRLKGEYPEHSIFSISSEQLSVWKNNNIYDNFWNETEAKQIRRVLEECIPLNLEQDEITQLMTTLKIDFNHKVEFSSIFQKYLQLIVYHSVARRLGIRCVLKPRREFRTNGALAIICNTENLNNAEYITIFDRFIKRERYNSLSHEYLFSNVQIVYWMINIHIFQETYCSQNFLWELDVLRKIINNENINITRPIKVKSDIVRRKPKTRNEEVKFAIGMIVNHICLDELTCVSFHFNKPVHVGVIIGWHYKCEIELVKESLHFIAPHLSEYKYCRFQCIFLHECTNSNQPHYIILSQFDRICYMQQDMFMELSCPPKWIENVEIGRYFSKFEGTHYVPNESLATDYPDDISAIPKILSNCISYNT